MFFIANSWDSSLGNLPEISVLLGDDEMIFVTLKLTARALKNVSNQVVSFRGKMAYVQGRFFLFWGGSVTYSMKKRKRSKQATKKSHQKTSASPQGGPRIQL